MATPTAVSNSGAPATPTPVSNSGTPATPTPVSNAGAPATPTAVSNSGTPATPTAASNLRILLRTALLLFCVSSAALTLFACVIEAPQQEPSYVSPYTWENLTLENGRYYYYEDNVLQSRFGIDVSEHQGYINWQAVAQDGVEFAFIRIGNRGATEGQLYLDDYFEANITGAEQAAIPTGVYFFSQAITAEEAREEARFVLEHLAGRSLDYPIVFDHESVSGVDGRANSLTSEEISRCGEAFFEVIEAAGYETMLYGNASDLMGLGKELLDRSSIWFAEYNVAQPTLQHDFFIWQYSNSGTIAGIDTQVDLNIHFLTLIESSENE